MIRYTSIQHDPHATLPSSPPELFQHVKRGTVLIYHRLYLR